MPSLPVTAVVFSCLTPAASAQPLVSGCDRSGAGAGYQYRITDFSVESLTIDRVGYILK